MSASWVTITTVMPCATFSWCEKLHDLAAAGSIEIASRLVGQQDQRVGDDGAGNGHALLLAAGQFGRRMVLAARKPTRCRACTARSRRSRRAMPR